MLVHELGIDGHGGDHLRGTPRAKGIDANWEMRATRAQVNHWSWSKTSKSLPEGYIIPVSTQGGVSGFDKGNNTTIFSSYDYVFQFKDHLGNVRLSYSDILKDGVINPSTDIIEESNYYPFGLKHLGYNSDIVGGNDVAQAWKFGGKEYNQELGLDWHDFGARNYDAALGRWMNIDPLSEEFSNWSPYTAMNDNPINFIDPTGMAAEWVPTVSDVGEVSYVAETGDSASSLSSQFGLSQDDAEAITGTSGDTQITEGTSISGEQVASVTGNEVLKLDLKNNSVTDTDIINQTIFSIRNENINDQAWLNGGNGDLADFTVDIGDYFSGAKGVSSANAGGVSYGFGTSLKSLTSVNINGKNVKIAVDFSSANDGRFVTSPGNTRTLFNGRTAIDFNHPNAFPKDPTKGGQGSSIQVMTMYTNNSSAVKKHLSNEN